MKRYDLLGWVCVVFLSVAANSHAADSAKDDARRFLDAGVPASDREWIGTDYQRAADIFTSKRVALPVLSDKTRAALLERMTSTENLAIFNNKSILVGQRMQNFISTQKGVQTITKLYLAADPQGKAFDPELSRLFAFSLYVGSKGMEVLEEFIAGVPKDDKYETRMAGVKRMHSGMTTMFGGCETMLGETDIHAAKEMSILIEAMEANLPIFKRAFPDGYRVELRKKLEERRSQFKGEDAKRIDKMIAELDAKEK